ncbi:hypothetical protein CAT7_05896 [Carnobacterium sp. AT7]|nr:hypothetical protein [Carnobacterium sp. AT7]EDP69029.1 hypothetical protein CAT7_05896 [Carnobacterium sp. AT7]
MTFLPVSLPLRKVTSANDPDSLDYFGTSGCSCDLGVTDTEDYWDVPI